MADMKISITLDARELMRQLGLTQAEIAKIDGKEIKVKTDEAASGFANLRKSLAETTLAFAGVMKGIQMLGHGIKALVDPSAEMEQLRLRLEAMYRDTDKARDAFDEFRKVAAKTPATLMQVAEAGAQLKAFGMDADKTVDIAANLAAYMGTDVVEAANAMGRAFAGGAGSAEQLRRRGILELISSFTGIEDLTQLTLPEFRRVMVETLENPAAGIAGTAATMAESYTGAVSNMQDAMFQLRSEIGNAFLPILTQAALGIGNLVNGILGLNSEQKRVQQSTYEQRVEFESLIGVYTRLHGVQERSKEQNAAYQGAIDGLVSRYPNFLTKQTLESDNWSAIAANIFRAREQLIAYNKHLVEKAVLGDANKDVVKAETKVAKARIELEKLKAEMVAKGKELTDIYAIVGRGNVKTWGQEIASYEHFLENANKKLVSEQKKYETTLKAFEAAYPDGALPLKPKSEEEPPPPPPPPPGAGAAGASQEEISETAKAYAKLLENLKKYHSDAALANLDAHQKKLAILASEMDAEQKVILDSIAAKEITEEEGLSRLLEIRGKYDAQALDVRRTADDEILALAQKRIEQAIKDEESYYETMKFADEGYYEWKKNKIEADVKAMAIGDQQKLDLIRELLAELDAIKAEHDYTEPEKKGSWFFSGLLGYDPGNPEDEAKIQATKDTFNTLFSQTTSVASGLLRLSVQRRDTEIAALEERAAKEGWANEKLLAEKQKITDAYADEERRYKRIQKALSIGQATINIAEGVTKALSMGPIIGPIMAAIITAMGAVQIGIISAQKFATGGLFRGVGGPRDDANLAYISNGEYIVNAESTKKYLPLLEQINEPGQPRLSSLDKGLLRTIAADYRMSPFFASGMFGAAALRAAGAGYADGGLVGGGESGGGLKLSAGSMAADTAPNIERKVDTIIDKLDVINLNLVKKKVEVVVQNASTPASIREMDSTRLRMEERGYVAST